MRVITGTARGKRLLSLEGNDVRPTTDRVKEAMFSSIQFELEGAYVADLYCGTGQLGIEALSRGARFCTFVDQSRDSQNVTKENLELAGVSSHSKVAPQECLSFIKSTEATFDIVILDPPYNNPHTPEMIQLISKKMNDTGVILCETGKTEDLPTEANGFVLHKQSRYGQIKLSIYRKPQTDKLQGIEETEETEA